MFLRLLTLSTITSMVVLASSSKQHHHRVWDVKNYKNLVTFGDSYTDESRLAYFLIHNGSAPPPGLVLPEALTTASGGRTWARYVVQYTGSTEDDGWTPQLDLYNYAVSGASCSHAITPRYLDLIHSDYPPVLEYQVPALAADLRARNTSNNETAFITAPTETNSVYALWIGTNDLGVDTFLTDSQTPGKTLTDYTECIYQVFDGLYALGARVFILMNTIPLDLTPLYANSTLNGTTAYNSTYWPDKPTNLTAISETAREYTTSVNTIFKYQTAFESRIACRYPGASFALFDTHTLLSDIYNNPARYFNGTQPFSVTIPSHTCLGTRFNCTDAYDGTSNDSFMWYDTLHPSEQTDRIIARTFVDVVNGVSKYATYY